MRLIIRSLKAASYHRILHVHPRKKGAEEHYQKIPFVPIFDRILKQNLGTLGIHAKHTQHSPPGLTTAIRRDFEVALKLQESRCLFHPKVCSAQEDCTVADRHAKLQDTLAIDQ